MSKKATTIQKILFFDDKLEIGHIQFHFKCVTCQLEFTVYSWHDDWLDKKKHACCPECEFHHTTLLNKKRSYKNIFEMVSSTTTEG